MYGVPILTFEEDNMADLQAGYTLTESQRMTRQLDGPGGEPMWVKNPRGWEEVNDKNLTHVIQFDYDNQAWVIDGVYVDCGHTKEHRCNCFGRIWLGYKAPNIH